MGEIGALLGRIINNLPDSLLLESLILGALATVLTAVIRIVWAGSSWLIERARHCKALARRCWLARGSSKHQASWSTELARRCKAAKVAGAGTRLLTGSS